VQNKNLARMDEWLCELVHIPGKILQPS